MLKRIVGSSPAHTTRACACASVAPPIHGASWEETGPEKSSLPGPSTGGPSARACDRQCQLFRHRLLNSLGLLDMKKARSRGRIERRLGRFELAKGVARFFWMKLASFPPKPKLPCCESYRSASLAGSWYGRPFGGRPVIGSTNRDLEAAVAAGTFSNGPVYRLECVSDRGASFCASEAKTFNC